MLLAVALIQGAVYRASALDYSLQRNVYGGMIQSHQKSDSPVSTKQTLSIFHVGDMMFDRGVRTAMENGYKPLSTIPDTEADFFIGNLEGPVTTHTECQEKAYSFRFDPAIPAALRAAGVDAVNTANNHSYDCYRAGYLDTKQYVAEAGIIPFGGFVSGESATTTVINGVRVALIGLDATISAVPVHEYQKLIESFASSTDLQFVSIHWGIEYSPTESEAQQVLAHAFVDAGADAVFGHHPHVVEPIENYHGVPIFYSLGNYIFDQTDPETRNSIGVKVTFADGRASGVDIYPFEILHAVPTFTHGESATRACRQLLLRNITEGSHPCHIDF